MIRKVISVLLCFCLALIGYLPPRIALAEGKESYNIAVLDLVPYGVSQIVAIGLSERLRTHFSRTIQSQQYITSKETVHYELVERTQMDRIFDQFDIQSTGCVSDSCAIEFGKILQVDRIIIGSVSLIGKTYTITARIVDVESGKTVRIADSDYKGSIDDVVSSVVLEVGDELLFGPRKKSRKIWYIIGGTIIAGGIAGKIITSSSNNTGTIIIDVPLPE